MLKYNYIQYQLINNKIFINYYTHTWAWIFEILLQEKSNSFSGTLACFRYRRKPNSSGRRINRAWPTPPSPRAVLPTRWMYSYKYTTAWFPQVSTKTHFACNIEIQGPIVCIFLFYFIHVHVTVSIMFIPQQGLITLVFGQVCMQFITD